MLLLLGHQGQPLVHALWKDILGIKGQLLLAQLS